MIHWQTYDPPYIDFPDGDRNRNTESKAIQLSLQHICILSKYNIPPYTKDKPCTTYTVQHPPATPGHSATLVFQVNKPSFMVPLPPRICWSVSSAWITDFVTQPWVGRSLLISEPTDAYPRWWWFVYGESISRPNYNPSTWNEKPFLAFAPQFLVGLGWNCQLWAACQRQKNEKEPRIPW